MNRTTHEEKNRTYLPPLISYGTTKQKVLALLNQGYRSKKIGQILGKAKSTISQHLNELERKGLVSFNAHSYKITPYGKQVLALKGEVPPEIKGGSVSSQCTSEGSVLDRAHNIKIKVPVLKHPSKNELGNWKINDKLKNNVQYRQKFGDVLVTYTTRSFIFQLPVLRFDDSEIALSEAGRIAMALVEKYESEIQGLKLGEYDVYAQVISQHHAVPNDPFAAFCKKHNFTYRDDVIDIDDSEGKAGELEFTDKEKSHIHHKRYIEHIKDVVVNELPKMSELDDQAKDTREILRDIAQAQLNAQKQLNQVIKLVTPINVPNDADYYS
jgi:hypothetical protein